VAFSVHAALVTAATLAQCAAYERGGQRFLSPISCGCIAFAAAAAAAASVVVAFETPGTAFSWLWLFIGLNTVKMGVSLVKYIPQACARGRRGRIGTKGEVARGQWGRR